MQPEWDSRKIQPRPSPQSAQPESISFWSRRRALSAIAGMVVCAWLGPTVLHAFGVNTHLYRLLLVAALLLCGLVGYWLPTTAK